MGSGYRVDAQLADGWIQLFGYKLAWILNGQDNSDENAVVAMVLTDEAQGLQKVGQVALCGREGDRGALLRSATRAATAWTLQG